MPANSNSITCFCALASLILVTGCSTRRLLDDYYQSGDSARVGNPADYINFLRTTKFTNGELDHLPKCAIIIYAEVPGFLERAGFSKSEMQSFKLGTSDPSVLFIVRGRNVSFMIEQGLPGAGGVTTQAAELSALGATTIVHIGTCGALKSDAPELFIAAASFKDGAGVLLSEPVHGRIDSKAYADETTSRQLGLIATAQHLQWAQGTGFTMPVFYQQPSAIYKSLLLNPSSAFHSDYVEMEQGPFFEMARRMNVAAASLVVPSDTVRLQDGNIVQDFIPRAKTDQGLEEAMHISLRLFSQLAGAKH